MAVADTASREKGTQGVKTKVLLEGPYGGPGHTVFASYSSLCLIGGGSGITFPLGVARDLVRKANLGQVRARTIDLVWIVRTQDIARPMIQELQELVEEAKAAEADRYSDNVTALRVHVYITRVPTSSPINLLPSNPRDEPDQIPSAAPSINYRHRSTLEVTGRRPQLMDLVFNAVEDTERVRVGGKESANGCGVVVCGPAGLVTDVRHVVSSVKEDDRIACGGLELHEEFFAV
jgi:ferredoxin-NADP reductase